MEISWVFPLWQYQGAPTAIDEQFPINRANTIKVNWTPVETGFWLLSSVRFWVFKLCLNLPMRCRNVRELSAQTWPKAATTTTTTATALHCSSNYVERAEKRINEKCKTKRKKCLRFLGILSAPRGSADPFLGRQWNVNARLLIKESIGPKCCPDKQHPL